MALFFQRFMGALVLDASVFEEIEAHRESGMQSVLVVFAACLSGGVAALGLGQAGLAGFVSGAVVSLGACLVWAAAIATIGTIVMPERETSSNLLEVLRLLGFAAAPGVFASLAAMAAIAPLVLGVVALWMIAASVLAVRQALDYRSTTRAVAVCVIAWALSFGVMGAIALIFAQKVS